MSINIDNAFGIHATAMTLRAQRAGLLAANLANADTPNYKARDLDFQQALADLMGEGGGSDLRTTDSRHLTATEGGAMGVNLQYRVPMQPSLDGNTVDPRLEQGAFLKNAMAYQASVDFLNRKVQGLMLALRGN